MYTRACDQLLPIGAGIKRDHGNHSVTVLVPELSDEPLEIPKRGVEGYGFLSIPVGWLFHPHN